MSEKPIHIPVLLSETIESLDIKPDGIYVDCTTGFAGHSSEIAKRLTTGRLIGFDRDPDAVKAAEEKLKDYPHTLINRKFSTFDESLDEIGVGKVDGVLMDLGVSSYQLDTAERGFSYHEDAPLDMRMSKSGLSAYDVVNEYSKEQLEKILFEYGEEKFAHGIVSGRSRTDKDNAGACGNSKKERTAEGPQGEEPLQKDLSGYKNRSKR